MTSRYDIHPMEQAFQEWDAKDKIFQRELNIHVCRKWDELITEGKHGHYETLLAVCRSAISFWRNRAETESQASADTIREGIQAKGERDTFRNALLAISDLQDGTRRVPLYEAVTIARIALGQER